MKERNVLVTTSHRGVFFGRLVEENGTIVDLADARMALHWSTTKGVLELAEVGPNERSTIGAVAPSARLHGVTGVFDVTPEAAQRWRRA
jgi:hypothetical protein